MVSSLWGCQYTLGFICELLVPVCHGGLTSKSHRLRRSGNYVWKPRPAGVKPWYLEAVPSWRYRSCAIGNLLRVRVSRFNGRGFAGVQQQPEVQKPQTGLSICIRVCAIQFNSRNAKSAGICRDLQWFNTTIACSRARKPERIRN